MLINNRIIYFFKVNMPLLFSAITTIKKPTDDLWAFLLFIAMFIKRRIESIKILFVKFIRCKAQAFAETIKVQRLNFPFYRYFFFVSVDNFYQSIHNCYFFGKFDFIPIIKIIAYFIKIFCIAFIR